MEALLSARDLRVDVQGVPAIDGLSVDTRGERVMVVGAARALFEAAAGMRRTARGALTVQGVDAARALATNGVAGAPADPPLVPTWSPFEYATWSARLVGHDEVEARRLALEALGKLRLEHVGALPLRAAPPDVRRAVVIAGAVATGAPVIVLEDPLVGLPDAVARTLGKIVVEALRDRRWVLFGARAPLDYPFAAAADEAVVLDDGRVVAQGDPSDLAARTRIFAVRVAGEAAAFADAVRATGANVWGDGAHLTIELTEGQRTRDLFATAGASRAVVVELRPLTRAFA